MAIEPKLKRHCKLHQNLQFPVIITKNNSIEKAKGVFNGFSVSIGNTEDINILISMGNFGKANFSRSYPQFVKANESKIIRDRQLKHRKYFSIQGELLNKKKPDKLIVIPDSDSENDYFINLKPEFKLDYSEIVEKVWLSLEEAFFLSSVIKCLSVTYKNEYLNIDQMWDLFSKLQHNFIRNYLVYYYYRSKNWVVKPGIKFGGDFLLYKQGPSYYHASYIILLESIDKTEADRNFDSVSLLGLNRLCESTAKELIICRVKLPKEVTYNNLENIDIQEILVQRWIPSEKHDN
ncbi:tRNA-splicing endonuclease subunit Sen2 isoform X1 [Sitophilus oryzae]|uniref:tRNA-splicing endonuclease subunit Sen2 n=1 Tax=Sitophilus oryzae TaxID=7048 RepID=A0A6J2XKS9_SITOR|nr:tRNA-splicing endonuclease subunit Sen2 isoform X1 [Sitophilus oryzae]